MNPVHRPAPPTPLQRFVFAVVAGLRNSAAAWHRARRRRAARCEMQSLDGHLLRDIGMRRCEIESMAARRYHA